MMDWRVLFGEATIVEGVAWLLAAGVLAALLAKLWGPLGKFKDFMDDVRGEAPRPGVPERPGLMVRLSRSEDQGAALADKVDAIATSLIEVRHEVVPNTGTSMNDAIRRTETKINDLVVAMADVHEMLDNDKKRIDRLAEIALHNHPEEGAL